MKHNLKIQIILVLFVFIFSLYDAFAWKPVIVGHRGSRTGVENTEEAFINGITKHGFQALECDVKVTSDKKYVCWHDDIITKCSPNCTIYSSTLATIQSKTLTQTRNGVTYTGKICTVDRYLEICKQYNVTPVVELKYAVGINGSDMSNFPGLYALIEKHGLVDKTIILTSMKGSLQYIRANYPRLTCQYLVNYISSSNIAWCKTNGCHPSGYYVNGSNKLTQALVDEAHNGGMHVGAFTMNNTADFPTYCSFGVNYLTTDDFIRKDLPELSGTDPNVPTTYTTIYYRPSTTNFANGYTDLSNKRADGGTGDGYQGVYWSKNGRLTASVYANLKGSIFLDYAKTKTNDDLKASPSSRFMPIKVPTTYTGVIVHRLGACTEANYNVWKHTAGATGISSVSVHNTAPRWTNSTTHIPAPMAIPTDGKNLLCNKEGWWDVWYWAYYLPKTNNVTMYFANTGDWKDVQLLTGKDIYTHNTNPTTATIPGTQLSYFALNGKEFGYTHYGFSGNGTTWDNSKTIPVVGGSESNWVYDESSSHANNKTTAAKNSNANQNRIANRIKYAPNRTGLLENLLSGANLYIPGVQDAKPTHTTLSSWSALNHTQTFVAQTGGKISCSTYKLTGANTSTVVNTSATAGTSTAVSAYTATVTLTAVPDAGYSLEGWYDGNTLLSNSPTYTYTTPNGAKTITAKFMLGAKKDVRAQTYVYDEAKNKWGWKDSNDGGTFTVTHSGGEVYTHEVVGYTRDLTMTLDPVTFTAIPNEGYIFLGWWNNLKGVFTANPWIMEIPSNYDESVTARFAKLGELNLVVERNRGGKIGITYDDGYGQKTDTIISAVLNTLTHTEMTLTAIPDEGSAFLGWYENNTLVSNDQVYSTTASETQNIAARFTFSLKKDVRAQTYVYDETAEKYVWIDSNLGGTFTMTHSGGQVYTHEVDGYKKGLVVTSDPVTFTSIPNSGYELIGWWNNPTVYTDDPWTMEHPEEFKQSVTARFAKVRSEMNASVDNVLGGLLYITYDNGYGEKTDTLTSLSTKLLIGSVVTLEAATAEQSTFLGWYENEELLTTEALYTFTVTDTNRNIVAKFKTDSTTTDLDGIDASTSNVRKILRDGQIYIYKNGVLHTITGQEL